MDEVQEAVETQAPRDFEREARIQGWKPKEEFQGDEQRWVDAQTFVERGEQFVGFLKPQRDRLERELTKAQQLNKDLQAHHERLMTLRQKEIADLEAKLKSQRIQALNEGNGKAFDQADQQLQELQKEKQQPVPKPGQQPPSLTPTAQSWVEKNDWYLKDKSLRAVADSYAEDLKVRKPNLSEQEYFDNITEYVKQEMPHKFQNPKRAVGDGMDSGRPTQQNFNKPKSQNYASLPPEAKAACDRMVTSGMIKDKEAYAKAYFAQEGV